MCFDINEQPSNLKTIDMTMNNITEKVEEGPYWERLLADKTKQHWLKVYDILQAAKFCMFCVKWGLHVKWGKVLTV